jgi:hypothetical protein
MGKPVNNELDYVITICDNAKETLSGFYRKNKTPVAYGFCGSVGFQRDRDTDNDRIPDDKR